VASIRSRLSTATQSPNQQTLICLLIFAGCSVQFLLGFYNMDHPNFIRDNLCRELIISMPNVTSDIYTYADSWMAAFTRHPKLHPSYSRALLLICRASLLFNHNHHFCRVHDMFTPFNIFMQTHSLVRSHTYMHYVNALHHGNPTKTYRWSGIRAIALKASKCFRDSQNLQKNFSRQRPVCSRHQDLRFVETFKNFTPCILYEITNHLL
jgi:hypothetical protein